jgi:hypothetical protein
LHRSSFWNCYKITKQNRNPQGVCPEVLTDIVFNPDKALNCQAHSAALYVALHRRGRLPAARATPVAFLAAVG